MVTTFYPPYSFGGDGIFVRRLSNELARRGHSVEVVHNIDAYRALAGGPPAGSYEDHPGVRVHGLRSRAAALSVLAAHQTGHPVLMSARLREVLNRGFDVIHYHNVSLMGAPQILKYGSAIKLYTMHEYWLVCPTHVLVKSGGLVCVQPQCFLCSLMHKRPPQLWRYSNRLGAVARHVDAFLALHPFAVETHRNRGFDGPMRVLPPFVVRPAAGAEPAGPRPRRYFLFVGRLERIKGVHTMLPAFKGAGSSELWIAGDGNERDALEDEAAGNPRIRFLGRVDAARLSLLYRRAVALIVPSLSYEAFPLVILEAFSHGTPVLVPRLGGMPDTVESIGAGFAFSGPEELAARLKELEDNSRLRDEMGRRGLAAYEQRWTPEAHLEQYFSIIDDIRRNRSE